VDTSTQRGKTEWYLVPATALALLAGPFLGLAVPIGGAIYCHRRGAKRERNVLIAIAILMAAYGLFVVLEGTLVYTRDSSGESSGSWPGY
jgi:hypothetical protein